MQNSPICIDSSVFISYLKGGSDRQPADVPVLKGFFNDIRARKVTVVFPTMERGELLECQWSKGQYQEFIRLLDLPNVEEAIVNPGVSEIAAEIRSYYHAENEKTEKVPRISLPDSIIVATAIVWECSTLYTYDGDGHHLDAPANCLA